MGCQCSAPNDFVWASGEWNGYFDHRYAESKIQCTIIIKPNGKIVGNGKDRNGEFFWKGRYELPSRKVLLQKFYKGNQTKSVKCRGLIDITVKDNRAQIKGQWKTLDNIAIDFWMESNETLF